MLRQMLLSLPVALVIGLSAEVAGQDNKIPDQAREILEKASQFELLSIGHDPSPKDPMNLSILRVEKSSGAPTRRH